MASTSAPVLRFVTANMDFATGGNKAYVQQLCTWADVLMLQEAKDFRLVDVLGEGWKGLQDTRDDAHAGSCIAVRTAAVKVLDFWLAWGCGQPKDGGMLPRYIAVAELAAKSGDRRDFAPISAHEPPKRYAELQPEFTRNLRKVAQATDRNVLGVDANMPIGDLARQLGPTWRAYGKGIIGILTPLQVREWQVRTWGPANDKTDHPAVSAKIKLRNL